MKTLLSVALVLALQAWASPLLAEVPIASSEKSSAAYGGKGPASDWWRVSNLAPGTRITLLVSGSPRVMRFFLASDESSLTVLTSVDAVKPVVISRESIVAIWRQPAKHVGRHATRGAIVGAILLGALAASAGGDASGGAALIGAAFGTWIGALVGVMAPKTADLVYRAPEPETGR